MSHDKVVPTHSIQRVVVVGGPGAGKSVLARRLAVVLEGPCVELDFRRAVLRSIRRVVSRQPLWNGNRESLRVLTPRSLARLWSRWPAYGRRIDALVSEHALHGGVIVRLRSAREVRRWLEMVENGLRS